MQFKMKKIETIFPFQRNQEFVTCLLRKEPHWKSTLNRIRKSWGFHTSKIFVASVTSVISELKTIKKTIFQSWSTILPKSGRQKAFKMDAITTTTTMLTTTTTMMTPSSTSTLEIELNITVTEQNGADYFYQVEQLTFLWVLFTLIVIGKFFVF